VAFKDLLDATEEEPTKELDNLELERKRTEEDILASGIDSLADSINYVLLEIELSRHLNALNQAPKN